MKALRESEAHYRALFHDHHMAVLLVEPETGAIVDANPAAAAFYGWNVETLRGMRVFDLNPMRREDLSGLMRMAQIREQGAFQFRHRRADGSVREVQVFSGPIRFSGRTLLYSIIHDDTDRLRAEAAVRQGRAKLEAALESMQDAVFITDREGRLVDLNQACATYFRFPDKPSCARAVDEFQDVLEIAFADGSPAPTWQWAVPRALRGERSVGVEYRLRRRDTGECWIGSYSYGPILDSDGLIAGAVVVARDITETKRMEAEVRALNAQLEQRVSERTVELQAANHELESFAYAVSHDLRAPLRAMTGFSHALMEDLGPRLEAEERGMLERIVHASVRMADLIDGLLHLCRVGKDELRREWVDVSSLAERIRADLEKADPARRVRWDLDSGLRAWADPRLLEPALRNLLDNAWKYSSGRLEAHIRLRGQGGRLTVEDNGAGFDMAHADKLFKPFQRLHRQDEFPGLGIGLATVQRIVQRHGGRIDASGHPDRGARFTLELPEPDSPA